MRVIKGISKIFSHPIGYVLLYIIVFGVILAIGQVAEGWLKQQEKISHALLIASGTISIFFAITIIVMAFRTSHLLKYGTRELLIAIIPTLVLFVATMLLVREFPGSAFLIMINGILLIVLAFILGELLSREVMNPGHLLPVAAVLALVDFWSVEKGPSKQVVEQITEFAEKEGFAGEIAPPFVSFLLLRFPQFITDEIYSFLGVADLVILAFFAGCVHRFNLSVKLSYFAMIAGPVLAILIANILERGIPALPVIALLFVMVNINHMKLKRKELIQSIAAVIFILIIIMALRFFL